MFDGVLNTLLCPSIHYNEIKISRWLATFYLVVFNEYPHRTSIYNANLFLESRNWKILSPKLSSRLITCSESVYRVFFLSWVIKSYLKIFWSRTRCAGGSYLQVRYKDASKMHFRCVLRCAWTIKHLSSASLYIERYAVFKIWFSVWIELFSWIRFITS